MTKIDVKAAAHAVVKQLGAKPANRVLARTNRSSATPSKPRSSSASPRTRIRPAAYRSTWRSRCAARSCRSSEAGSRNLGSSSHYLGSGSRFTGARRPRRHMPLDGGRHLDGSSYERAHRTAAHRSTGRACTPKQAALGATVEYQGVWRHQRRHSGCAARRSAQATAWHRPFARGDRSWPRERDAALGQGSGSTIRLAPAARERTGQRENS